MTQRSITLALLLTLLLLFSVMFYMQHELFFQKSSSFIVRLRTTERYIEAEKWNEALHEAELVEKQWNKGEVLISIKYAGSSFTLLNIALGELKAAIRTRDPHTAAKSVKTTLYLFENITSISPRSS
ncbi:hypothetical protein A374_10068 [Fictibacillus macauensis ZFHKF-1]|uniref:DUF4363 family protein n=1 Tax=Fictibacillus macauensis ZFHKF-1 TaxID=1196324 RepID=I8UFA7_9BACL|nr:DUF4363 family protein [Fictibacillus macauensis]EIT85575.1 hypothetical protein A374_10068 [Fictibacillus macauensis ZFHKF-1]